MSKPFEFEDRTQWPTAKPMKAFKAAADVPREFYKLAVTLTEFATANIDIVPRPLPAHREVFDYPRESVEDEILQLKQRADEQDAKIARLEAIVDQQIAKERAAKVKARVVGPKVDTQVVVTFLTVFAYDAPSKGPMRHYVMRNHARLRALIEAANEIRSRFDGAQPHFGFDEGKPVISIPTALTVEEGERRFAAFMQEWWLPNTSLDDSVAVVLDWRE
jgi:hypothetical protein